MENNCCKITLVCFNCGKKKDILINRPPMFSFELANIADEAGLKGVIDMHHNRALVFCNDECANNQKTKKGTYRIKPKKINVRTECKEFLDLLNNK
jgi:hypothetical protein